MHSYTLSIVGRDENSGHVGVALCASLPAAGAFLASARAGVGAVAVQGAVHPVLRQRLLDALAEGRDADSAMAEALAGDGGRETRQVALVDARGGAAAFTGEAVRGFAGHRFGPGYAIVGSYLARLAVIDAMEVAFRDGPALAFQLPQRLLRALEAGLAAGGDSRGHKSAALLVAAIDGYPFVDLRVDEHGDPVAELRRIHDLEAERFMPGYEAWVESLREGGS